MKPKADILRPPGEAELRINLRLKGKPARAVRATMAELDVDAPTAVRILIAQAANNRLAPLPSQTIPS
jgi:hypothetical protein